MRSILLLLAVGCVTYGPVQATQGTVTDKSFTAAWSETVLEPKYTGNAGYSHQGIKMGSLRYRTDHHPARYEVTVRYGGEVTEQNNRTLYESVVVGQRVTVQFHYPIDGDSAIAGEPSVLAVTP